jgi:serine protease Do
VTPTTDSGQDTPAAKIGMQASDIIVEFEGAPVLNAQDLIQRVASTPVGQQVTIAFLRDVNGKLDKRIATVALGERPPSTLRDWVEPTKPSPKTSDPRGNSLHLGITLAELTPQLLADRHLTGVQGLYVKEIDPNGLVAEIRIQPLGQPALAEGDVITRINKVPVTTLADFQRVLNNLKAGDPIVLNVTRLQRDAKGDRLVPLIVQFTYQ